MPILSASFMAMPQPTGPNNRGINYSPQSQGLALQLAEPATNPRSKEVIIKDLDGGSDSSFTVFAEGTGDTTLDPGFVWLRHTAPFAFRLNAAPPTLPSLNTYFPDTVSARFDEDWNTPYGRGIFQVLLPAIFAEADAAYLAAFNAVRSQTLALGFQNGDYVNRDTGVVYGSISFDAAVTVDQMTRSDFSTFDTNLQGSRFNDVLQGTDNGRNTLVASPGEDTLRGGNRDDTFDYRGVTVGAFGTGWRQTVDGKTNEMTGGEGTRDLLQLPGSPGDYQFKVDRLFIPQNGGGKVEVGKGPLNGPFEFTLDTTGVDRVTFAEKIDNAVDLYGDHVASEALFLAAESYGPRESLAHTAEALAFPGQFPSSAHGYISTVTVAAEKRGWHPVSAMELGLKLVDDNDHGSLRYSFVDGFYAAYPIDQTFLGDTPEANAVVLTGLVGGKRTLAIAFRGTDQIGDFLQYGDMARYYNEFLPLLTKLDAYIDDPANGIEQVLVSGHSLGAGAVQRYMEANNGDARYRAYTAGSAGGDENAEQTVNDRVMNFVHTQDLVARVPGITQTLVNPAAKVLLAKLTLDFGLLAADFSSTVSASDVSSAIFDIIIPGKKKFREGSEIFLNSERADSLGLDEHDKFSYAADAATLHVLAADTDSLFFAHPLAFALRGDTIYKGGDIQIAPGDADANQIRVLPEDDYALGGGGSDTFVMSNVSAFKLAGKPHIFDGGEDGGQPDFDHLIILSDVGQTLEKVGEFYALKAYDATIATLQRFEAVFFPARGERGAVTLLGPNGPLVLDLATGTGVIDPAQMEAFDFIKIQNGDRTVTGSDRGDRVFHGDGNQTINGGLGNDLMLPEAAAGGGGSGASGSAASAASTGYVRLNGQNGNDVLVGRDSNDVLDGGSGDDIMSGGGGADHMVGRAGDDVYVVDNARDRVNETDGGGVDTVLVSLASYSLIGVDVVGAVENLTGVAATGQSLTGNALINAVTGGAGDDTLNGGAEADILNGGDGIDLAAASGTTSVVYLDLLSAPGQFFDGTGAVDLILSIEGAVGGSGADFLNGDNGANTLRGGGATDAILGRGGADAIEGGDGDDYLMGGDAYDPAQAGSGNDTIDGGDGTDIVFGMDGNDVINGGAGADFVLAGAGDDTIDGGTGNDFLFGGSAYIFNQTGAGNDTISGGDGVDLIVGGAGGDRLNGDAGADIVYGGGGADFINSAPGVNLATAGAGDDSLFGDAGNDVIAGGSGFDYIYGGGGADTFVFRKGDSYDAIFDFSKAEGDKIRLDPALGATNFAQFQAKLSGFTFEGIAYTVLNFPASIDQLTIKGISHTAWTAAMVEFA